MDSSFGVLSSFSFFFSYRKEGCPQAVRWSRLPAPTSFVYQKKKEKIKLKYGKGICLLWRADAMQSICHCGEGRKPAQQFVCSMRSRLCLGAVYLYPTRRPSMYVSPYGKTGRPVNKASYQPLSSLQGSEIPPHPFRLRRKAKIPKKGGGSGLDKSLRRQGQQEV